ERAGLRVMARPAIALQLPRRARPDSIDRCQCSRSTGRNKPMTRKKRRRLAFAIALLVASAGGAALVVAALKDNVLYFYSPSDVAAKGVRPGIAFHIGGLVARGSVKRGVGGEVQFTVTDG